MHHAAPLVHMGNNKRLSMSSSHRSSVSPLFDRQPRTSIDSSLTTPELALAKPALHKMHLPDLPISDLADVASSLVTFFWLQYDFEKPRTAPLSRGTALPRFARFMHDILATTQLTTSAVVYALIFINRLRTTVSIRGQPGSEFSVGVTALMIANKVTDDNTYSANTWSSVSGISLNDLVAAEREFLNGIKFNVHVSLNEFLLWQRLVDGLGRATKHKPRRKDTPRLPAPGFRRLSAQVPPGLVPASTPAPDRNLAGRRSLTPLMLHTPFPQPFVVASPTTYGPPPHTAAALNPNAYLPHSNCPMGPSVASVLAPAVAVGPVPNHRKRRLSEHSHSEEEQGPAKKRFHDDPPLAAPRPSHPAVANSIPVLEALARARATPQTTRPPELRYTELAAGQRNGVTRVYVVPHLSPLSLPLTAYDPRPPRAFSLSPTEHPMTGSFSATPSRSMAGTTTHVFNPYFSMAPFPYSSPPPQSFLTWRPRTWHQHSPLSKTST